MATPLTGRDYYENSPALDDEDDEVENTIESGACCAQCEDPIHLADEIFLLRVVRPFLVNGELKHFDVLEPNGEFTYEPAFFDFGCWEEEQENLETIQEDIPPVPDEEGMLLCDICRSDIRQGECVGLLNFGEMQWSERSPNNQHTFVFAPLDEGKHICTACLAHLDNERTNPIWPQDIEPVPGADICVEGVFTRCWRYGNCTCPHKTIAR